MSTTEFPATSIRPWTQSDLTALEHAELERFTMLLNRLGDEEWMLPSHTPDRTVYAVVAHVAGSYAAQASLRHLSRQFDPRVHQLYRAPGQPFSETVSKVQIGDRMSHRPDQLIEEIRLYGERAIGIRSLFLRRLQRVSTDRVARPRKFIRNWTPATPLLDLWKHRLEIAMATSRPFDVSVEHDLLIFEHFFRTAGVTTGSVLEEKPVSLSINEIDGMVYRFGGAGEGVAEVAIPAVTLARLICGWHSAEAARERSSIKGDIRSSMVVLRALAGRQS